MLVAEVGLDPPTGGTHMIALAGVMWRPAAVWGVISAPMIRVSSGRQNHSVSSEDPFVTVLVVLLSFRDPCPR